MQDLRTVENILGSRSSLRVLRVLFGVNVALSVTQIAHHAGLTRPAVETVLGKLYQRDIVRVMRSGNTRTYQIVRGSIYVEQMISVIFTLEDNLVRYMQNDIAEHLREVTFSVVLYGSFSRNEQTENSDVDIVCVSKNALQHQNMNRVLDEYSDDFSERFGFLLSPLAYTYSRAMDLKKRAPLLFAEIRLDGIIICGNGDWIACE